MAHLEGLVAIETTASYTKITVFCEVEADHQVVSADALSALSLTSPPPPWPSLELRCLYAAVAKHPQAGRPGCVEQRHEPCGPAGLSSWQHGDQVHQWQRDGVAKGACKLGQLWEAFRGALGPRQQRRGSLASGQQG